METPDNKGSNQEESNTADPSKETQEQYVARKAYEEVTTDMHKFKSKAKSAEAKIAELEARIKAEEEAKLKEQNEWQQLYEREKQEKQDLLSRAQQQDAEVRRMIKLSALKTELGGSVRDEYLQFADIDSIQINEDGSLSSESVQLVANKFRQDHPTLVSPVEGLNITKPAPGNNVSYREPEKTPANMSYEEKMAALRELRKEKFRS